MSFFSKLLSFLGGEPDQPPADEREVFALRVHSLVKAAGLDAQLDVENYCLNYGNNNISYLGNHYDYWRGLPEDEREAGYLRVAEAIMSLTAQPDIPTSFDQAAPQLLARLRPLSQMVALRLEMGLRGTDSEHQMASLPVGKDLGAQLVFDTPQTIIQFPRSTVVEWNVELEQCFDRAVQNLRALAPEPFIPVEEGVFAAAVGDCYDSARLLLLAEIRRLAVRGRPVALPANRDTLLITGSEDEAGLHVLLEAAVGATKQPRLDTLQLLVLGDDGWSEWLPPTDHALYPEWAELAVRSRGTGYADVREQLQKKHEIDLVDVFVAGFGALEKDGRIHSYAVWPPVPTWLPEADLVSIPLSDDVENAEWATVPWAALHELAGDLLERVPDVEPPYWRTSGHPTQDRLDALRQAAVEL